MENLPVIYLGTGEEPSPVRILKAGTLECLYLDGAIRHVKAGGREILRMVYPAVRDHNWGTVPGEIGHEEIKAEKDSFSIRYNCRYIAGEIDYHASIHLSGNRDNTLTFSMQGKALSSFKKNRIGLNILHPIKECTGRSCRVITHAGKEYRAEFPMLVSPHKPMKNIRSLAWTLEGDIQAFLGFSGEVFEMEDQRNWTDASYKTYCTPLELPFPVLIREGETLKQEVYLKVEFDGKGPDHDDTNRIVVHEQKSRQPFPAIGLTQSSETGRIHPADLEWIRMADFYHYRFDLQLYTDGWHNILASGMKEAAALDLELELGLFFDNDHSRQLAQLITEIRKYDCRMARVLVFTRDHLNNEKLSAEVIPVLKNEFKMAGIGTGTNANFAELNRNRPEPGLPDFLVYSINPQVHAFDPMSMVENMEGQAYTVITARTFAGDNTVCISPVTLKPRFNIVATSQEQEQDPGTALPSRYDCRQASLFCAGWTLGSFKYLAESGAGCITFYDTYGRGGIIHGQQVPVSPDVFPADRAELYPVYFLFRELLKYKDFRVQASESSHPVRFSSLLLEGRDERLIALANHTADIQRMVLPVGMIIMESWVLDEHTIQGLRKGEDGWHKPSDTSSLSLNPYAVTFLKIR